MNSGAGVGVALGEGLGVSGTAVGVGVGVAVAEGVATTVDGLGEGLLLVLGPHCGEQAERATSTAPNAASLPSLRTTRTNAMRSVCR